MRYFIIALLLFLLIFPKEIVSASDNNSFLLTGSVVKVPETFFGTWRVKSILLETNAPQQFKKGGIDFWNISQVNNVISLCNPFTGASADLKIQSSENNTIEFTKISKFEDKLLVDKVTILIKQNTFEGFDELRLVNISEDENSVSEPFLAKFRVSGERIVGLLK